MEDLVPTKIFAHQPDLHNDAEQGDVRAVP